MLVDLPDNLLDAFAKQLAPRLAGELGAVIPAASGSPWMSYEELVEYTKIPDGTLRKRTADGTFTSHGGKSKVYHRDEVDAALMAMGRAPKPRGGRSNVSPLRKAS